MSAATPPEARSLVVDFGALAVEADWIAAPPRTKSLRVLEELLEHPGELRTKAQLLASVWRGVKVGDGVVKVAIRDLRRALGEDREHPLFIETVRGRGYRYVGELEWLDAARVRLRPGDSTGALADSTGAAADHSGEPALASVELGRDFRAALRAGPRLSCLVGRSGLGKTALLEAHGRALATAGEVRLLRASCWRPLGPEEAYRVIADLLLDLCRQLGDEACAELLARHAPRWLLELPSLAGCQATERLRARLTAHVPARMTSEAAQLLTALADRRSLVIMIDDLHEADDASLDVLAALLRAPRALRLHLVASCRPSPPSSPPSSAARLLDDPRFAARVHAIELDAAAPPRPVELGEGREPARLRILELAALLEPGFSVEQLCRVSGQGRERVEAALGALVQTLPFASSTQADPGRTFVHAGVREYIRAGIEPHRRGRLHLEIARALSEAAELDRRGPRARKAIAGHFEGGGCPEPAFEALRDAAEHELEHRSSMRAYATFVRAHELGEALPEGYARARLSVLERLIDLAFSFADLSALQRYCAAAYELASASGELRARATALVWLATVRALAGPSELDHVRWERDTLLAANEAGDAVTITLIEASRAHLEWIHRRYPPRAEQLCAEGHALAVRLGLPCAGMLGIGHAHARLLVSDYAEAHRLCQGLTRAALTRRSSIFYSWSMQLDVLAQLRRGRWGDVLERLERLDDCAARAGALPELSRTMHMAADLEFGRYAEVVEQALRTRAEATQLGLANAAAIAELLRASALLELGQLPQARAAAAELDPRALHEPWIMPWLMLQARLRASADRDGAREAASELLARATRVGHGERHFMAMAELLLAELDLEIGAGGRARARVERALAIIDEDEMLPTAGRVHGLARRVCSMLGDREAERVHDDRAGELSTQLELELGARPELAQIFARDVAASRWRGRPAEPSPFTGLLPGRAEA